MSKKRVKGFGKGIKAAAKFCGIEPVSQFLCFCHIADIGEGIVIALVGDAAGIEHMFHKFPAVYIGLDIEREPCLYLDEHEAEFLIQIVEVIRWYGGNSEKSAGRNPVIWDG